MDFDLLYPFGLMVFVILTTLLVSSFYLLWLYGGLIGLVIFNEARYSRGRKNLF